MASTARRKPTPSRISVPSEERPGHGSPGASTRETLPAEAGGVSVRGDAGRLTQVSALAADPTDANEPSIVFLQVVQAASAGAGPSLLARRIAKDQRVRGHIAG